MANSHLLWRDLNLTGACVASLYPLDYNNASWNSLVRIENARSIAVVPETGSSTAWELGAELAAFLQRRNRNLPLPHLRSLTIRFINWDSGITNYLHNLTELDMTGVHADPDTDLCGAIEQLSPSLKRLKLDRWRLCPGFFAVLVGFSKLEYLSISRCRPSKWDDALLWFMTGHRIPPREAGCGTPSSLFETRAHTVMPSLRHLDFSFQHGLLLGMLHAFHVLRLQRRPTYRSSPPPDPARTRPHSISMDLRHCPWIKTVDVAHLQHHFPDTQTTPTVPAVYLFPCIPGRCRGPR